MQIEVGERGKHLARDVFSAAADGSNANALAAQVSQGPNAVRIWAEEHERLGLAEATDELQRLAGGPVHTILNEGKVDGTRGLGGEQPCNVLDRASRGEVGD